jgi:hypothetical protein
MNKRTLEAIAKRFHLRLSETREQGKRVFGLHGFLSNIEEAEREIKGYYIQQADTGHYLYSYRAKWN